MVNLFGYGLLVSLKIRQSLEYIYPMKKEYMLIAEHFIHSLVKKYGKHPVSTDGGGTWYPLQACRFLKLQHHIHHRMKKV